MSADTRATVAMVLAVRDTERAFDEAREALAAADPRLSSARDVVDRRGQVWGVAPSDWEGDPQWGDAAYVLPRVGDVLYSHGAAPTIAEAHNRMWLVCSVGGKHGENLPDAQECHGGGLVDLGDDVTLAANIESMYGVTLSLLTTSLRDDAAVRAVHVEEMVRMRAEDAAS